VYLELTLAPFAPCLKLPDAFLSSVEETFERGIVAFELRALAFQFFALGL
jgi:hypothetical protein